MKHRNVIARSFVLAGALAASATVAGSASAHGISWGTVLRALVHVRADRRSARQRVPRYVRSFRRSARFPARGEVHPFLNRSQSRRATAIATPWRATTYQSNLGWSRLSRRTRSLRRDGIARQRDRDRELPEPRDLLTRVERGASAGLRPPGLRGVGRRGEGRPAQALAGLRGHLDRGEAFERHRVEAGRLVARRGRTQQASVRAARGVRVAAWPWVRRETPTGFCST